jgi:hypothetical protein
MKQNSAFFSFSSQDLEQLSERLKEQRLFETGCVLLDGIATMFLYDFEKTRRAK